MGAAAAGLYTQNQQQVQVELAKLKREDCIFVKHDDLFTPWKILVGPSDWEDHSAGKEGVERYRLHNLPNINSGSGVYELGIIRPTVDVHGKKLRKLKEKHVMVVYIGKAENIRQRLQRYGQTGSHLEGSKSGISLAAEEESKSLKLISPKNGNTSSSAVKITSEAAANLGLRLFSTTFDHGYTITFRWASAENNEAAERVESQLLKVFDYAWNKDANGARRPHEILAKLAMESQASTFCGGNSEIFERRGCLFFGEDKAGIDLNVRKPLELLESRIGKNRAANILLFSRSRPHLTPKAIEGKVLDVQLLTCGAMLENGQVCTTFPRKGRKRCEAHKGMRVVVQNHSTITHIGATRLISSTNDIKKIELKVAMEKMVTQGLDASSMLVDTSKHLNVQKSLHLCSLEKLCSCVPKNENQSSLVVKLNKPEETAAEGCRKLVCGIIEANGSKCLEVPQSGRKRCLVHKGMQLSSSLNKSKDVVIKEILKPQIESICNY